MRAWRNIGQVIAPRPDAGDSASANAPRLVVDDRVEDELAQRRGGVSQGVISQSLFTYRRTTVFDSLSVR
jgi:hypothetical protein